MSDDKVPVAVSALASFFKAALFVIGAFCLALLFRFFVMEPFLVPTESMLGTINANDHIVCEKVSYRFNPIKQGDIVCFESEYNNGLVLVKRVIATAGQTVDLYDGKVLVDGQMSPYGSGENLPMSNSLAYPYTVPEGYIWVMGDNREHSSDSRVFGPVPEDCVIGRVILKLWPPEFVS